MVLMSYCTYALGGNFMSELKYIVTVYMVLNAELDAFKYKLNQGLSNGTH